MAARRRCGATGQSLQSDRRVLLEEFRLVDFARKVVGVGSVGTRAWIALMLGRDDDEPLFLQFKEAQASVLEEFTAKSEYRQPRPAGRRRPASDAGEQRHLPRLGARRGRPRRPGSETSTARQLKDWKGSFETAGALPAGMTLYGQVCGWTLARAHARSGDRIAIAAYLGGGDVFDRAIADFSAAYADQNERDYDALVDAVKAGTVEARTGL